MKIINLKGENNIMKNKKILGLPLLEWSNYFIAILIFVCASLYLYFLIERETSNLSTPEYTPIVKLIEDGEKYQDFSWSKIK